MTEPKQPEALRLADEWQRKTQREADRQNSAYDHYDMGNTPETVDPLGAKMTAELRRLHTENERLAALVEAQQSAKAENLRQILTDPENQPNQYGVQFLMRGPKMAFKIGARQFTLDYEPDEPGEFEFMRDALISAFSIFTPDVKMAQHPAPRQCLHKIAEPVGEYPPLPKPALPRGGFPDLFDADQMHAYVDADRAMRAQAAIDDLPKTQEELDFMLHVARIDGWHSALGKVAQAKERRAQAAPAAQEAPRQAAQEPCPTCVALARTVMLDQVSFDRKPDCYGIRQITDDEGVEEWEDIRTSPDVAREEANDMMATGRGETYEVVPLYTAPQPAPVAQGDALDAARWRMLPAFIEEHQIDYVRLLRDIDDAVAIHSRAQANTRQIAECYGDCPADPKTCTNPCNFEGRAARAQAKEGQSHE